MRIAFIVLLLANLAFMAWARWVDAPPQAPTSSAASRLPRLKLVGEVAPSAGQQGGNAASESPQKATETPSPAVGSIAPSSGLTLVAHQSDATPDLPRCVSVGPFSDQANAGRAATAFHTRGFTPQQRAAAGEKVEGYWVSVGKVDDADAADKVLIALDKGGFRDAHLMPDNGEGRTISVGLFSERARAERRAAAIEKLGLKTRVGERRRPATVYWVDVALRGDDGSVPQELLADAGGGGVGSAGVGSGSGVSGASGSASQVTVQSCPPGVAPVLSPVVAPNTTETVPAVAAAAPTQTPSGPRLPSNTVAGTPRLAPAK